MLFRQEKNHQVLCVTTYLIGFNKREVWCTCMDMISFLVKYDAEIYGGLIVRDQKPCCRGGCYE